MSSLYENKRTSRSLQSMINDIMPPSGVQYFFVISYPRSDMGKGTLVAQLLNTLPGSDAIKFDGLLNTNATGRHTASGHDDFGVYEKFNPGRKWGKEHYLLGGELFRDFINKYGENENLQINPHMSLYVEYRIHKMWKSIGSPAYLIIEVGGVLSDPEVEPIFAPMIQKLSSDGFAKTILLSEIGHNGDHIKTKTLQDGIRELRRSNITPWALVARETQDTSDVSMPERYEFERIIADKIHDSFNLRLGRIISVPHYKDLSNYTSYVKERFTPYTATATDSSVVIATGNPSKFNDFMLYLGSKYELQQSTDFDIDLPIPEGINSIEDNAIAKARAWAMATNRVAIGDDTGFFIRELGGEPGVALRRWGGELGDDATNEMFWNYLKQKTMNLESLECYFNQCIAIATPQGDIEVIYNRNEGFLNRAKLRQPYNGSGYPLAAAFESLHRKKTWDEMSDKEKIEFDQPLIDKLEASLRRLTSKTHK